MSDNFSNIESVLGKVSEFGNKFDDAAFNIMELEFIKSTQLNFTNEGREPAWEKKKRPDGRAILIGRTRRLSTTISTRTDRARRVIEQGVNVPYGRIHNEGGEIIIPARSNLKKKKTSGQRKIIIPQRQFIKWIAEDSARAAKALSLIRIKV